MLPSASRLALLGALASAVAPVPLAAPAASAEPLAPTPERTPPAGALIPLEEMRLELPGEPGVSLEPGEVARLRVRLPREPRARRAPGAAAPPPLQPAGCKRIRLERERERSLRRHLN